MISKQRVDVAVKKYKAMLGIFREFDFSLKDLYDERKFAGGVSNHFANYLVCGKDNDGLRIMWIDGGVIPVEEEKVLGRIPAMHVLHPHLQLNSNPR